MKRILLIPFGPKSSQGFIGILVAFALIGAVVVIYLVLKKESESVYRGAQFDLWDDALDQLKLFYESNVDCDATRTANPGGCPPGTPVEVHFRRNSEPTRIRKDPPYSSLGLYELRASCKPGRWILLEARPRAGVTHPLRKRVWTEWADVYRGADSICRL